jgi:hypothetical protein
MAGISSCILGNVSGKIGNVVIKEMNGKFFVSLRQPTYRISRTYKAAERRNKFTTTVKFARHINSIPALAHIWQIAKLKGSRAYNRIIKYNLLLTSPDGFLTTNNIIIPNGIGVQILNLDFDFNEVSISVRLPEVPGSILGSMKYHLVYCFQKPESDTADNIVLFHFSSENITIRPDGMYNFNIVLTGQLKDLSKIYKSCIVYLMFIFDENLQKKVRWTNSYSKEFTHNMQ